MNREEREEYGRQVEDLRTRMREALEAKKGLRIEELIKPETQRQTEGEDDHHE